VIEFLNPSVGRVIEILALFGMIVTTVGVVTIIVELIRPPKPILIPLAGTGTSGTMSGGLKKAA
jgi:hypothetical protein